MGERAVIVGPGRMGLALGAALVQSGSLERLVYFGRALEAPPHPLFEGEAEYLVGPHPMPEGMNLLILAVPDRALGEVAQELARAGDAPAGCVALHLSGALSADVMAPLHAVGYAVGSFHPLQAVADPWSAADRLVGSSFAVAGEPAAVSAGRRLADALRGRALVIPPTLRPLYHAAAVFSSNYLVALLSVSVRQLAEAGIEERDAVGALLPLVRGTLDNLEHLGVSSALTGPVARGDIDTIRLHLARLSAADRSLYCLLGLETLRLARAAGLDSQRADELESLLAAG